MMNIVFHIYWVRWEKKNSIKVFFIRSYFFTVINQGTGDWCLCRSLCKGSVIFKSVSRPVINICFERYIRTVFIVDITMLLILLYSCWFQGCVYIILNQKLAPHPGRMPLLSSEPFPFKDTRRKKKCLSSVVYSCHVLSVLRIGSGSTAPLTRINQSQMHQMS